MSENDSQEKTEEATPKRREDTRKKGQIPRSRELNTFTSLLAASAAMFVFGKPIVDGLSSLMLDHLAISREAAFSDTAISSQLGSAVTEFALLLAPLFLTVVIVGLLSPIALGGWIFSFDSIMPKMERISIVSGFGRLFSSKSLVELAKALGKFVLVAAAVVFVVNFVKEDIFLLSLQPLESALDSAGWIFVWCFVGFSSVLALVVLIDVPFQLWQFSNQIRMTRQETTDEHKETEGRPEVKRAIRERQQEFARQRMMAEVPKADVVITNPTHYAVALRYDQFGRGAPRVVAKGRDLVAARIREIAKEHKVMLFEAPPLARALYASTELNQEIPANLFVAVAQVLAYIFQLRKLGSKQGKRPSPPTDLPVPEDYFTNTSMTNTNKTNTNKTDTGFANTGSANTSEQENS